MSDEKYVSVNDLEISFNNSSQLYPATHYGLVAEVLKNGKPMIAIEDIKEFVEMLYPKGENDVNLYAINGLRKIINPQPEKHGGLTIEQWEQLRKHPYVRVEYDIRSMGYLFEVISLESIARIIPDLPNMTRTALDLPDGIEIEITETDSSKGLFVTPIAKTKMAFKHYRILGVAEDE